MIITYYLPEGKGNKSEGQAKFIRKQAVMECCENALILKTYNGIKKQIIEQNGSDKEFKSRLKKMKDDFEER